MKLVVYDKNIAIICDNESQKKEIKKRFTFKDASQAFMGGSFNKRNIKNVSFVKKEKNYLFLPSGFLKDLLLFIKNSNYGLEEIVDKRDKISNYIDKEYTDESLRKLFNPDFKYVDHQIRALRYLMKTNKGIIKAVTSSGKTEIIIAFLKIIKLPTLIIVNKITLAQQIQTRLQNAGLKCGLCYGKACQVEANTVTTIQSIKKVPDLYKYKMIIVDEVHNASANSYQDFLKSTNYSFIYGFSATPEGNDKFKFAKIQQYFGPVLTEIKASELMKEEVIARPEIKFIESECHPTLSWQSAQEKCVVNNEARNNKIIEIANSTSEPTLILIRIIEHGENLKNKIPDSVFISGKDSAEERRDVIKKIENGEIKTVISSNIFNEGISINSIKVLIIASGGKSKIETLQKLGRALRTSKDKKKALIYDFFDRNNRFTEKHSLKRKYIYKKAGFKILD